MLAEIGYVAAVLLGLLFLVAAVAKLGRRDQHSRQFSALALPGAALLSRAVPVVELALAATLVVQPRVGGALALVALAAFSVVLRSAIRSGIAAPCGCFGTARTAPVSSVELVRNTMFALLALAALAAGRPGVPSIEAVMTVSLATVSGALGLALADLGRQVGGVFDNSAAVRR